MKRKSWLKNLAAATLAAPALVTPVQAETTRKASDRAEAVSIIANARKILNPGGVQRLQTVRIGGIEQWTSVRGTDLDNPVLLLLHGGPGYVSMPMSWWSAQGWDEYFTVIEWDQRGAGKTYLINDPAVVGPTMTMPRMVADAEEMVEWARVTFKKRKIVLAGHSWGSYLGLELAKRHPDWFFAYVGVEQLTNGPESERRGWTHTMNEAKAAGNLQAIRELNAIAPYFAPGHPASLKDIYVQRKWLDYYGGVMAYRKGNDADSDLAKLSPDYTSAELARIWEGNAYSEGPILAGLLRIDQSNVRKIGCPIVIFAGRHDVNVNSYVALEWYSRLKGTEKQFVWFEHSAHIPMTEEPGKFLLSLVTTIRPYAV